METDRSAAADVLVIEDDRLLREILCELLASNGYRVMAAANGTDGLKHFATGHYGVIITDVRMPGPDGWEVARRVSAASPEVGIIVMSGLDPRELRAAGGRRLTTLAKPFTLEELLAAITRVTTIPVAA
jgi:DNA-binding response OmpR family regulator